MIDQSVSVQEHIEGLSPAHREAFERKKASLKTLGEIQLNSEPIRWLEDTITVVFRNMHKADLDSCLAHPNMIAASWSNAIHDRDRAINNAECLNQRLVQRPPVGWAIVGKDNFVVETRMLKQAIGNQVHVCNPFTERDVETWEQHQPQLGPFHIVELTYGLTVL